MIKLLTIDCPMCDVLENKLKERNISFVKINDLDELEKMNIEHFPCLEVEGKILSTKESFNYVNNIKEEC